MRVTAYQFGTVGSILTFFFFSVRLLHVICYITSYVTTTVFILPMYTKTRTYSAKQDNKTTPRERNLPTFLTTSSTNIPDQANFPQTMHDTYHRAVQWKQEIYFEVYYKQWKYTPAVRSNILPKLIFASCVWYSDRAYYGLCFLIKDIGRGLP